MTFVPVVKKVTIDGTVTADVTGEGDVPVTLDSEVVAVDATGQGDVPVTLDSEVVDVDATGQGDVPITLDGEEVTVNLGATDNGVLDNIDSNTDYGAVVGGGAEATALRVTLANDSTGVVSIDDGGNTITVDGSVDVTGSGDVPITLDSEVVAVDATGQGDVPITLDGETVELGAGTASIGKLAANSGVDIGDVDVTSIAAGETHVGQVGMEDDTITITCSLDTSAYADGDVLFDTQEIAGAVRNNGETCILQSIHVIDIDDQGEDFDLVFFNAATSLGTENSAPDINDTEVLTTLGVYEFVNAYMDLGANQVRTDTGIGLLLEAGAATTSLYVAGISRGTGTYTASGIRITFGFLRN
jgi:hypothetical protein